MADNSLTAGELKDKIGQEWEFGAYDVEKGMVQRFARAIDDPNPLWQDEEYAGQSRYGGIIAPPTFIVSLGGEEFGRVLMQLFPEGLLHGSTTLECHQPVRPGDRIAVTVKLANVRERRDSAGDKTTFVTFDITYQNQRGELVARCQYMMVGYETGKAKNG